MLQKKNFDELNNGYLTHGILAKIYKVVDYIGNKLFCKKSLQIEGKSLLFINLGLIGDLILFRYVIENFLKLDYKITILIQDKYKFLFNSLSGCSSLDIITISNYKDKKILRGFIKIYSVLKQHNKHYAASLHFRGYLGTGILSTYLSRVSKNLIGYGTSGFGFLLNYQVKWRSNVHETRHILDVLQAVKPDYSSINLNIFDNYLNHCDEVINKYGLSNIQYIVIHATSQDINKNIPLHILEETVKYIVNNTKCFIVFVGLANEISYIKSSITFNHERMIVTNGVAKFFEVYCLLSKAKAFIGVDSSIAHLSSPLMVPKIIMWHSQNILNQWKPLGENVYIINNVSSSNVIIDQLISIVL